MGFKVVFCINDVSIEHLRNARAVQPCCFVDGSTRRVTKANQIFDFLADCFILLFHLFDRVVAFEA